MYSDENKSICHEKPKLQIDVQSIAFDVTLVQCCLQIFRALSMPLTSRMLSEILSRLVETVAEQGEETQVW